MAQKNPVFINKEGIIEIQVVGDQTVKSVESMGSRTMEVAADLKAANKRVMVLDNLLEIGNVPPEARRLVMELVKSNDYDKLAMLGSDTVLRLGANLLLQATGKGTKVKYFEDREKCTAWLLEP